MPKKSIKTLIISNLLFLVFCFAFFPAIVRADATYSPQVGIPGTNFAQGSTVTISNNTATIAEYVKAIYKYLIGIVGIVAAIMLMVGGIRWLTAGGSPEAVKQAQDYIVGSITGLALALGSFLILATINPALVNFRITGLQTVANIPIDGAGTTTCCGPSGPISPLSAGGCPADAPSCDKQCIYADNKWQCQDVNSSTCCEYYAYGMTYTCSIITSESCPSFNGIRPLSSTAKGKGCNDVGLGSSRCGNYTPPTEGCCLDTDKWCQKSYKNECSNFQSASCDKIQQCQNQLKGCCYFSDTPISGSHCVNGTISETQCKAQGYNTKFKSNSHCGPEPFTYDGCCN